MTSKQVRCRHCNINYIYHPSGDHSRYNNDTYCPDCYSVILEALKVVPVKKRCTYLPVIPGTSNPDVTMEEIEKVRSEMMIPGIVKLGGKKDITNYCVPKIRGVSYELRVNKKTEENLIFAGYEEDIETGEITGIW